MRLPTRCVVHTVANVALYAGIEDPNSFFQVLLNKPYAANIVWGPHFYAQSVIPLILPKKFMQGPGLYKRMSDSFGYLTTQGYCAQGKCLKWPVLLGEFSAPHAGGWPYWLLIRRGMSAVPRSLHGLPEAGR